MENGESKKRAGEGRQSYLVVMTHDFVEQGNDERLLQQVSWVLGSDLGIPPRSMSPSRYHMR